jgi:hypothetical protein
MLFIKYFDFREKNRDSMHIPAGRRERRGDVCTHDTGADHGDVFSSFLHSQFRS